MYSISSWFSTICISFLMFLSITTSVLADWKFQDSGVTETLNDVCFVDELHGWAVGDNSTIIATTDGGKTWVRQECPVEEHDLQKVDFVSIYVGYCIGHKWFGGSKFRGVILATRDGGNKWVTKNPEITLLTVNDLSFVDDNTGWVAAKGVLSEENFKSKLFYTSDGGNTWEIQYDFGIFGYPQKLNVFSAVYFIDKNNGWSLYAIYEDNFCDTKLFETTNGGKNWSVKGVIPSCKKILNVVSPDTIWVSGLGIDVSYDGGWTWNLGKISLYFDDVARDIYPLDGYSAYVLSNTRLRFTDDAWKSDEILFDIPDVILWSAVTGFGENHLWCVGRGGMIVKYTTSMTSVNGSNKTFPFDIMLKQNTPNPFNSMTSIGFYLSRTDYVELIVYNITGKKVSTLVSDLLQSGYHIVMWDGKYDFTGSDVASGIYIYELKNGFKSIKKKCC